MTTCKPESTKERSYHHGDLRDALISQAVMTVANKGIEALSLRQLARDLGVSHAAPARHFRSKSDLLGALAAFGFRQLSVVTMAAAKEANTPVDAIKSMLRAYVKWSVSHPELHMVMRNPDVTRHAGEQLLEWLEEFRKHQRGAVEAAQATGWQSGANPDLLQLKLAAAANGAATVIIDPLYNQVLRQFQPDLLVDQVLNDIFPE